MDEDRWRTRLRWVVVHPDHPEVLLPAGTGPWAARGWFAEAERWLRATMDRLGRPVTATARQARVWQLSCVLRARPPPTDPHMAQSTAWWLRQVLAGLR
jgi:hypothetical protein